MRKYAWCFFILFFIAILFFLPSFGPRAEVRVVSPVKGGRH